MGTLRSASDLSGSVVEGVILAPGAKDPVTGEFIWDGPGLPEADIIPDLAPPKDDPRDPEPTKLDPDAEVMSATEYTDAVEGEDGKLRISGRLDVKAATSEWIIVPKVSLRDAG